jgi:hypothetical protein
VRARPNARARDPRRHAEDAARFPPSFRTPPTAARTRANADNSRFSSRASGTTDARVDVFSRANARPGGRAGAPRRRDEAHDFAPRETMSLTPRSPLSHPRPAPSQGPHGRPAEGQMAQSDKVPAPASRRGGERAVQGRRERRRARERGQAQEGRGRQVSIPRSVRDRTSRTGKTLGRGSRTRARAARAGPRQFPRWRDRHRRRVRNARFSAAQRFARRFRFLRTGVAMGFANVFRVLFLFFLRANATRSASRERERDSRDASEHVAVVRHDAHLHDLGTPRFTSTFTQKKAATRPRAERRSPARGKNPRPKTATRRRRRRRRRVARTTS